MNKQIRRLAAGLLVCYLALFAQLNLLQVFGKEELDAKPQNNRQILRDFNRMRGAIITADGVIIAQTVPATEPDAEFKFRRQYPGGDLFAHLTGYYSFAFGSTQLERVYDDVLMGDTTAQQVGAVTGLFQDDVYGSVVLTLRADVQEIAAKALIGDDPDNPREGSVVVIEPASGKLIAMVSYPRFDPNLLSVPEAKDAEVAFDIYEGDTRNPLLANAYQERYMPGSAFKVITTGIALENDVTTIDRRFDVETAYEPPQTNDPVQNYGGSACGGTMVEVFYRSCNIPFARMAIELGPDKMLAGCAAWGIGEKIPFDLPGAAASNFANAGGQPIDFDNNLPLLAIGGFGQANDQMVPLHMAMVAGAVANGGTMMTPYVTDATLANNGELLTRSAPQPWKQPISPATADTLTTLMIGVVNQGTGKQMQLAADANGNPVQAAAKTGTAQLNTDGPERSNAWIIGFAPAEQPRYAIAVVVKGGDNDEISASTGGKIAGPIAKQILDYLISTEP